MDNAHKANKTINENNSPDYVNGDVNLFENVHQPSYKVALDWMKVIEHPQVTYDFWARGNYTKRMIYNRNNGINPLIVPVKSVGEIRWAYKRLSLIGIPVEFSVLGSLSKPSKVLHLCPSDIIFDSGWGYIGALGTMSKIKGREWFPVIGQARLLPEYFVRWLIEEVPDDFMDGNVFISPAELVGIDSKQPDNGLNVLSHISNGTLVNNEPEIAKAILQLDIPYVDNISQHKLRKILNDYEPELYCFRKAFKELIVSNHNSIDQVNFYLEQLRYEVAELCKSKKHQPFRLTLSKSAGVLAILSTSFPVAEIISQGLTTSSSLLSFVAGSAISGAALTLTQLLEQHKQKEKSISDNPFYLLWKLGITKPSEIQNRNLINLVKIPKGNPVNIDNNNGFHWLCPPTNGLAFLGIKK